MSERIRDFRGWQGTASSRTSVPPVVPFYEPHCPSNDLTTPPSLKKNSEFNVHSMPTIDSRRNWRFVNLNVRRSRCYRWSQGPPGDHSLPDTKPGCEFKTRAPALNLRGFKIWLPPSSRLEPFVLRSLHELTSLLIIVIQPTKSPTLFDNTNAQLPLPVTPPQKKDPKITRSSVRIPESHWKKKKHEEPDRTSTRGRIYGPMGLEVGGFSPILTCPKRTADPHALPRPELSAPEIPHIWSIEDADKVAQYRGSDMARQ